MTAETLQRSDYQNLVMIFGLLVIIFYFSRRVGKILFHYILVPFETLSNKKIGSVVRLLTKRVGVQVLSIGRFESPFVKTVYVYEHFTHS